MKFLGLRTVVHFVAHVAGAKAWYAKILNQPPYFDEPFYVGFNVGGYELGIHPIESNNGIEKSTGIATYWGVDDIEAVFSMLIENGASIHEKPSDVGGGIKIASVLDPFGNVFGIIYNPHFTLQEVSENKS